jgi:nickel/cobalt transporter (NicO) family protein
VNASTPALIAAAAGVGLGHAILPDHWLPLAVVGRNRRYSRSRVARLSGLAGITHVLVSLLLGAAIITVGLQFRATVEHAQSVIVGGLLLATGLAFAILEASGRGHTHAHGHQHPHDDEHAHDHHTHNHQRRDTRVPGARAVKDLAAIMVPFGAAASPDLTILPVFLAAATVGAGTAVGSLIAFAVATVGTIVGLTLLAASGAHRLRERWLERWGNALTAGVLIVIGGLVLAGLL